MGKSKAQKEKVLVVCKCGCGKEFKAYPKYRPKSEGGGLRVPEYMRGHHPNCIKGITGPAWNKGLKKGDHPSLEVMGFQPDHKPYNDWSSVNEMISNDPEFKAKWLASKKGQTPWNKGKTKDEYPNGIAQGDKHGNWKGGYRGIIDTAEWQKMRRKIQRRDKFTCQQCGDRNHKGRGSRIKLEVHHIEALCNRPDLAFTPSNLILLCSQCHRNTHNYGTKARIKQPVPS